MYGELSRHAVLHIVPGADAIQGEHGVGIGKKASLIKELGVETVDVMKKIKASLDPRGIMNPGKVFDL